MADDLFKPFSSCFIPKKKKKKKTWGISLVLGAWNQKQREKKVSFRPESGFATEDILLLHLCQNIPFFSQANTILLNKSYIYWRC